MIDKTFLLEKLGLAKKDKQKTFSGLADSLSEAAEKQSLSNSVKVNADGNWFSVSFDAVQEREDRLVISARRVKNGIESPSYDPTEKIYIVEFEGTRAAYLRGNYKSRHPIGHWPYLSWDIRSYANHPENKNIRVYVKDFRAHEEIKLMIKAMERVCGTSHIVNTYIKDNLLRFQNGIRLKLTPEQIEKSWSRGLMEGLGYHYVEAFDTGRTKGQWEDVSVHWCKNPAELMGERD